MHVLQLPPRHLLRVTLLAALLALALTAVFAARVGPTADDGSLRRSAAPPVVTTAPPARTVTTVRPPLAPKPSFLGTPSPPPAFGCPPPRGRRGARRPGPRSS